MDKKNKTVADIMLEEVASKLEDGLYPLSSLDYSIYPEIKKFVDDFNNTHPHLTVELINDTDNYKDKLEKAESDLVRELLECTNLFKEYYEVSSMYSGIITYYMVLVQMYSVKLKELQEKLDRYENND